MSCRWSELTPLSVVLYLWPRDAVASSLSKGSNPWLTINSLLENTQTLD